MTRLQELIDRGRSPLGPRVQVDLGTGLFAELADLFAYTNGFTVFNAGIQLFHIGDQGLGPELLSWNSEEIWKYTYGSLVDDLFFFAQDLFGVQFAIESNSRVCTFDPETGDRTAIGGGLDDWADWLLAEPDERGAYSFATHWQDSYGALGHDERLLPRKFFVLGGTYDDENLMVEDAAACMRIRGPIAAQIHDLPDGATIRFNAD